MAWTSPQTWASGPRTAAEFNREVRDNFLALNGFVYKTADESVNLSTTLQNDNHLAYAVVAGSYVIDMRLMATSAANAAGDLSIGFTFPTATFYGMAYGADSALASGSVQDGQWGANTLTTGVVFQNFGLSTAMLGIHFHGLLICTAAGTLQLQWAQQASNANNSTLKAGSYMTVKQVA